VGRQTWRRRAASLLGDEFNDGDKLKGTIVCISACYHAANSVGIANKDNEVNPITMSECVEKFKAKVASLQADARKNPAQFMASRGTRALVNLSLQIKLSSCSACPA